MGPIEILLFCIGGICLLLLWSKIMTTQEHIDAIAAALGTIGGNIQKGVTDLTASINALKSTIASGQPADFTQIDSNLAAVQAGTDALGQLDTANPPPVAGPAKK